MIGSLPLAYLLGYWIGDGWYVNNHGLEQLRWICNADDYPKVAAALEEYGTFRKFNPQKSGHLVYTSTREMTADCISAGLDIHTNATNKRLPVGWLDWAPEFQWKLLEGLMDSDGSVSKPKENKSTLVYYATVHRELAGEVYALMTELGLKATARPYELKADWSKSPFVYYVRVSSVSLAHMNKHLTLQTKKQERLEALAAQPRRMAA